VILDIILGAESAECGLAIPIPFQLLVITTLSKKYPTLGQEKKVAFLGGAQFLIPHHSAHVQILC
jgi:hypothetical protein